MQINSIGTVRIIVAVAALSGFLAVGLGAFGAHLLEAYWQENFEPQQAQRFMQVYDTASLYHMVHTLALLATAWLYDRWQMRLCTLAAGLFIVGILLFSGSLYLYTLTAIRIFAIITPIGGMCLMLGWLAMTLAAYTAAKQPPANTDAEIK